MAFIRPGNPEDVAPPCRATEENRPQPQSLGRRVVFLSSPAGGFMLKPPDWAATRLLAQGVKLGLSG